MKLINVFKLLAALSLTNICNADLIALEDNQLSSVDGEGIGIVLEDFIYQAGEQTNGGTFEISGLQTSDDKKVSIGISQFYIAGSGSNQGVNVNEIKLIFF